MLTKEIGEILQLMMTAGLALSCKPVLMPYGDSLRYDLVIDEEDGFKRIQCKTGRLKNGILL